MAGLAVSGAALAQDDDDQTIDAKALDDHECDDTEWHFVITHVDDPDDAPESINVTWASGAQADVELDRVTGKVAHYTTTLHLDSSVTQATAEIDDDWDGQFNLSHGPCEVEGQQHEITIRVMKHECDADLVQDIEDFETVDTNNNGQHEFVDTVLACPTIVEPGDEQANGALAFDEEKDFDFEVEGDDGEIQNLDDATYVEQQLCESEEASQDAEAGTGVLGADVSNDGDTDDCLDTSLYRFDGVANGSVSVTETQSPLVTRPGALEFTPDAVMENNDADSLQEGLREVFSDDATIELDTTVDDNGDVTLHVYNFPVCPTTSVTAEQGPQNNLDWTTVDGADAYKIYRGTQGSGFEELATTGSGSTTFEDTDVEQGETYRYQVTAIVDGQESQVCNTAVVTAIPVFPSAIAAASAAVLGVGAYAVVKRRS